MMKCNSLAGFCMASCTCRIMSLSNFFGVLQSHGVFQNVVAVVNQVIRSNCPCHVEFYQLFNVFKLVL